MPPRPLASCGARGRLVRGSVGGPQTGRGRCEGCVAGLLRRPGPLPPSCWSASKRASQRGAPSRLAKPEVLQPALAQAWARLG
eukprot:1938269-Pyramimonas_sp.AAC.1